MQLTRRADGKAMTALLPMPSQLQRFIRLPDRNGKARFLTLENVIGLYLDRLFPGHTVVSQRRLPHPPRQRHRSRGRSRRSGAPVRVAAEAPPPRFGDPAEMQRLDAARSAAVHRRSSRYRRTRALRGRRPAGPRRNQAAHPGRAPRSAVQALSPRAFPSASAITAAIASPPSGPRTSSSITRSKVSTWWCSSCARRRPIPTWWRSSRRFIAPARTARSCGR